MHSAHHLSLCHKACNDSRTTEQIIMKLDIREFYEKWSSHFIFFFKFNITGTIYEKLKEVLIDLHIIPCEKQEVLIGLPTAPCEQQEVVINLPITPYEKKS